MARTEIELRNLFCGIDELIPNPEGKYIKPINFDNGATTPCFKLAMKYIENFIPLYGSVGRGAGYKSVLSTDIYKISKKVVLDFFNITSKDKYEVIYGKNATEGINLLSNILIDNTDDIVISTRMEHHSNDLPWRKKCKVIYGQVLESGRLDIKSIEKIFDVFGERIKLITVTGASNVTGFVNDIHYLAKLAHSHNAFIIVDGAQLVPHKEVFIEGNEYDDYIDFLVFSAHKMYAPFGIGAVVGRKEILDKVMPDYVGGGEVKLVSDNNVIFKDNSEKFEAGTQNLMGILALMAAMKAMKKVTFKTIENLEEELLDKVLYGLSSIKGIELYGERKIQNRLGIVGFNINGIHHEKLGDILALEGVSVRTGCFCAQPYVKRLLKISDKQEGYYMSHPDIIREGIVRVSFGLYNSLEEVNKFLNIIEYISKKKKL